MSGQHGMPMGQGAHHAAPMPHHGQSILEENWDIPRPTPEAGKPIHKAQQPTRAQMTRTHQGPRNQAAHYPTSQVSTVNRAPAYRNQPAAFPGYGVRPASGQKDARVENAPRRKAQWEEFE